MAQRQPQLATMEDKKIPELSKLLSEYVDVRDARMALTPKEVQAKGALLAKLNELKLDTYRDPETQIVVTLEEGEPELKVKTPKAPKPKDDEEKAPE